MADENEKFVLGLLKKEGNNVCADCSCKDVECASYVLGVLLCRTCANIHQNLGAQVSKVKHLRLDRWEQSQLDRMKDVGNNVAKLKYEQWVPACYRRPLYKDPIVLLDQWIRAKYEREEFIHPERQTYTSGFMEGFLMKRGKDESRFHPRKFVINETDDSLKYFVKEKKDPKASLRVSDLNVAFAPVKLGNPNSMQLTFVKDGSTRHIYVYHDDPQTIVNWYLAIRSVRLNRLLVAFPSACETELSSHLTKDFGKEGWLWKTGPRSGDAYRRRWFTLDDRKLMYHEEPLDPYPKGEIFLGHHSEGFLVFSGVMSSGRGSREYNDFCFTLVTPERSFLLAATSDKDQSEWMEVIDQVTKRNLVPRDTARAANLVPKRSGNTFSIFAR